MDINEKINLQIALNKAIITSNIKGVQKILSKGYDASDSSEHPSDIACSHGRLDILKLLIEYGAHPEKHHSCLRGACQEGQLDIVKFLIEERKSSVHAAQNAALLCCTYKDQVESLKLLEYYKVDLYRSHSGIQSLNKVNKEPTVLTVAIQNRAGKIFDYLMEKGFMSYYGEKWIPEVFKEHDELSRSFIKHIHKCNMGGIIQQTIEKNYPEYVSAFLSQALEVRMKSNDVNDKKIKI